MTTAGPRQLPLSFKARKKRQVRSQFGALCFRKKAGKLQFLLITSRHRKRWIIPKGWPEHGLTPSQSAANEAWEEAGVVGRLFDQSIGVYSYVKESGPLKRTPCIVMVYPLRVKKAHKDFPEKNERKRKWYSRKQAAARVDAPELKALIKTFDPHILKA